MITVLNPLQLSAQLKALRKSRGLTQAALGAQLGVGQSRIAEIEADPGSISVAQLIQLFQALGARMLVGEAGEPIPLAAREPTPPRW